MPSRKRKSRTRRNSNKSKQHDFLSMIRRLVPPPNEIFHLSDFLARYTPSLKVSDKTIVHSDVQQKIDAFIISPLETIKPSLHLKVVDCREPVPSIVDDVIWTLVQRRDRYKRIGQDARNVLAQGFSSSPPDDHPSRRLPSDFPSLRPGLTQFQTNDNVTFCKSSPLVQNLHRYVGDEVFRMLLLHTRLFVPFELTEEGADSRGNYCLVCGPPLAAGTWSELPLADASRAWRQKYKSHDQPRKKKRRRCHPPIDSHLQANQCISRFHLFYSDSFTPRVGLHNHHPFCRPTITPEKLLTLMADLKTKNGERRTNRWKRLRGSGVEICRTILASSKKCDYHRLIEKYCPLPDLSIFRKMEDKSALESLVQYHNPQERVVSFVRGVLCKVFPHNFWGSQSNLECLLETVNAFVLLRRSERLSNKRLMHGIRTTHLRWLQSKERKNGSLSRRNHEVTCQLALQVFRWLFRGFIIPLLRSNFYVTETEFSAKKVLYYRKPVWSVFRSLSMRKLLQAHFQELTKLEVIKCLSSCRMGFSRLRLVPKATGVRPIAHLSQQYQVTSKEILGTKKRATLNILEPSPGLLHKHAGLNIVRSSLASTNTILEPVFDVLTYESTRHDEPFGSGLRGMADFYPRYQRFITGLKHQMGRVEHRNLNLTFASVDIEKCYDNINQDYMYDIASRQLSNDNYIIQKFNRFYEDNVTGRIQRVTKKIVGLPESYGLRRTDERSMSRKWKNAVLDSRTCHMVQGSSLNNLLHEHLVSHLVVTPGRYEKRYLVQTNGISQGSILSMLLCNLYYGNIENRLLNKENPQSPRVRDHILDVPANSDFLARQVDDFLFISSSKSSVASFLKQMWFGRPELGIKINQAKTLVSEEVTFQVEKENEMTVVRPRVAPGSTGSGKQLFPWCGFLFDVQTGEVFVDYNRFQDCVAKDSLTVHSVGSEGLKLATRMKSFARPRCVPILFDNAINRRSTIVTNFYQMMLFAAAKTAEYMRSEHVHPFVANNEDFILNCIDLLCSYSGRQIRCNLKCQSPERRMLVLADDALEWLTWHAFFHVFSQLDDFSSLRKRIESKLARVQRCPPSDVEIVVERSSRLFVLNRIIKVGNNYRNPMHRMQ